jgi:long-chain acyl-CoA synthetase
VPGVVMRIVSLDDQSVALQPGEKGEIAIRGPNVTPGYFVLVDRNKDLIISGGFDVYPAMIEDAVSEHLDVAECAAIGIPDEYRGQAAKVFVALKPGAPDLTVEMLREFL